MLGFGSILRFGLTRTGSVCPGAKKTASDSV